MAEPERMTDEERAMGSDDDVLTDEERAMAEGPGSELLVVEDESADEGTDLVPEGEPLAEEERAMVEEPVTAAAEPAVEEPGPPAADDEARLLDRRETWAGRWSDIQIRFVDDPRRSIAQADELVAEVLDDLTANMAQERARLESEWKAGVEPSTEDLRLAVQRYRSLFDRLLAI